MMRQEVHDGGHASLDSYLMLLFVMDNDNRKDWEKRLMSEINELKMINSDVKALQLHLTEKPDEIVVPEWITDPQFREECYQVAVFAEKYQTFDLLETKLIPEPIRKVKGFDERLREQMDVDAMIEESN